MLVWLKTHTFTALMLMKKADRFRISSMCWFYITVRESFIQFIQQYPPWYVDFHRYAGITFMSFIGFKSWHSLMCALEFRSFLASKYYGSMFLWYSGSPLPTTPLPITWCCSAEECGSCFANKEIKLTYGSYF